MFSFLKKEEADKVTVLNIVETKDENSYEFEVSSKPLFGIKSGSLIYIIVDGSEGSYKGILSAGKSMIDWDSIIGKKVIKLSEMPQYLDYINR